MRGGVQLGFTTDPVFLQSYMIKHIRICALTVAVLMKSGRKPFTV